MLNNRLANWLARFALFFFWILLLSTGMLRAQVLTTTTITDVVYRADGTEAAGTLLISWPAFTTASGLAVPAGTVNTTIGAAGELSVGLAPNIGAMPAGSFYTVVYHLDDGTVSTEFWVVPATANATISGIRSVVVPTSIAVQSVSLSYVNEQIAALSGQFVPLHGGSMEGSLDLYEDPLQSAEAATKHYVDQAVSGSGSGVGKLALLPTVSQVVVQPALTSLEVNDLQSVLNASQYQTTPTSNDGIAQAGTQSPCVTAGGCTIYVDPGYNAGTGAEIPVGYQFGWYPGHSAFCSNDTCGFGLPNGTHIRDERGGSVLEEFWNPESWINGGVCPTCAFNGVAKVTNYMFDDNGRAQHSPQTTHMSALWGGVNDSGPGGVKTNWILDTNVVTFFTPGQHMLHSDRLNCRAPGDCMFDGRAILTDVGMNTGNDEGLHWGDVTMAEDGNVYLALCNNGGSSGCGSAGSTTLYLPPASGHSNEAEGEERWMVDLTSGVTTGHVAGSSNAIPGGPQTIATLPGELPASTFIGHIGATFSEGSGTNITANDPLSAVGDVAIPVLNDLTSLGYSGVSSSWIGQLGCVMDNSAFPDQAIITAVNTTVTPNTVTMHLSYPQYSGATLAVGGTCGMFMEITADTTEPNGPPDEIRQLLPLYGSSDTHDTLYWTWMNSGIFRGANNGSGPTSSLYASISGVTNVSWSPGSGGNGIVTLTANGMSVEDDGYYFAGGYVGPNAFYPHGVLSVSGVSDSAYNTSNTVFTIANAGVGIGNAAQYQYVPESVPSNANPSGSGVSLTICNCGFKLYQGTEVHGIENKALHQIDGTFYTSQNKMPLAIIAGGTYAIASISRVSGTVTVALVSASAIPANGDSLISVPSIYGQTTNFAVSNVIGHFTSSSSFWYYQQVDSNPTFNESHTSPTLNGSAPANASVAGGDLIEEAHTNSIYMAPMSHNSRYVYQPAMGYNNGEGIQYGGGAGQRAPSTLFGWSIANGTPASTYERIGGTTDPPSAAFVSQGMWRTDLLMAAPENAVLQVGCKTPSPGMSGCGPDYPARYALWNLDSSRQPGKFVENIWYDPSTVNTTFDIGGQSQVVIGNNVAGQNPGLIHAGTGTGLSMENGNVYIDNGSFIEGSYYSGAYHPYFGLYGYASGGSVRCTDGQQTALANCNFSAGSVVTSGNMATGGTLTVGSGSSTISAMNLFSTGTISPSAVAAGSCSDQTFTVTGLSAGDRISGITPPGALGNVSLLGYPNSSGMLLLHFCNASSAGVTPPNGNYSFLAVH